ncbi:MAG: type II secretion system F family protein [bacterium]|nr:type II secretion system F family protein [bacterium]
MAVFSYRAVNPAGQPQAGTLVADTPAEARRLLRARGLRIQRFAEALRRTPSVSRVGTRLVATIWDGASASRRAERVAEFARHLALLLRTGVPLAEGLDVLIGQTTGTWETVLGDVRDRVNRGSSLVDALGAHPRWFDALFLSAARVGEQAGALDSALGQLALYLKDQGTLRQRLTTALVYPMILATMGVGVVLFLMSYVIPQLLVVLQSSGRPLPTSTAMLKALSDALVAYWPWLILILLATVGAGSAALSSRRGRGAWHRALLRMPVLGPLLAKTLVARFAQQMAMLLGSGVPFTEAVAAVRRGARNLVLAGELKRIEQAVEAGSDIAPTLIDSRIFPPLVAHLVAVGQNTGELTEMLAQLRTGYETEVDLAITRFTAALEPLLIVVMAAGIGFVIFATLMPILEVTRVMQ